jgi:UDP-N-acetylmuramate--alanine ligase
VNLKQYKNIYFLGIGGIGMSALARYFNSRSFHVLGYDKTPSELTDSLKNENISIHFDEEYDLSQLSKEDTFVIYTPAIPKNFSELTYFQKNDFIILKRAEVLGLITESSKGIGVAGTHGKTTTSTLLAHVLHESDLGCNAFLGGISSNYDSNIIINKNSEYSVIEADEFDRSFLKLKPFASILTSTDPDHLDIYGNDETIKDSFQEYIDLTADLGCCVIKKELGVEFKGRNFTYSINEPDADFFANHFRYENGAFLFDIKDNINGAYYKGIELGLPGIHNAENATAVFAMVKFLGLNPENVLASFKSFQGVKRRFDIHVKGKKVYIDDYAHHPSEIKAFLSSVRLLFPTKKIRSIFQPHLYSRTNDFMDDFALELSNVEESHIMPIYPARELPMTGVTSEALLAKITTNKKLLEKDKLIDSLGQGDYDVLVTMGAGDIDRFIEPIKEFIRKENG